MRLIAVLLVLFTSACAHLSPEDIFDLSSPSSIRVLNDHSGPRGSASVINAPHGKVIITNEHVCRGLPGEALVSIYILGGTETKGTIIKADKDRDLCAISLKREVMEQLPGLRIGDEVLLHEKVYALGYPRGNPLTLSSGHILARATIPILDNGDSCSNPTKTIFGDYCVVYEPLIITSAVIYPGNSGSPALNESGEVIGIFNSGDDEMHYGNIIPLERLTEFLLGL